MATDALLAAHELADVGMIKSAKAGAASWTDIEQLDYQPCPFTGDYRNNRHLWSRFVIDAHGVSLLTSAHLEHAKDLSGWLVESLGADRYLVSSRNLDAWYANPIGPDRAVIDAARADFGDMILTWERIAAEPGPYTNLRLYGRRP